MKRHTCIICGRKRYQVFMKNVFSNSWACEKSDSKFYFTPCYCHSDIILAQKILLDLKKLKILTNKHLLGVR